MVKIKNISFIRGNRHVFKKMNLTIPRGKITAILGQSGIGKTTLLRLIGGQLRPYEGEIWVDGVNILSLERSELYAVRKKMSMLFQNIALFTDMNVFDNVAFPLREHTLLAEEIIHTIVIMKLEAVGLRWAAKFMPDELSGGMARRAALARSIALDPQLILLDEPFVGQDLMNINLLIHLITELNKALGITCVIVSHNISEVLKIAHKAYVIAEQNVIAEGTSKELQENKNSLVRQLIDGIVRSEESIKCTVTVENYAADLLGCKCNRQ